MSAKVVEKERREIMMMTALPKNKKRSGTWIGETQDHFFSSVFDGVAAPLIKPLCRVKYWERKRGGGASGKGEGGKRGETLPPSQQ